MTSLSSCEEVRQLLIQEEHIQASIQFHISAIYSLTANYFGTPPGMSANSIDIGWELSKKSFNTVLLYRPDCKKIKKVVW